MGMFINYMLLLGISCEICGTLRSIIIVFISCIAWEIIKVIKDWRRGND